MHLFQKVCDIASDKEVNKVIVDSLVVEGTLSTIDRYQLGVAVAEHVTRRRMNARFAFVGKSPTMDGFAMLVAHNQGITIEIFSSHEEALNWLETSSDCGRATPAGLHPP